jgi:hypothetical protein
MKDPKYPRTFLQSVQMRNSLQEYLTEVYFVNYSVSTRMESHRPYTIFSDYVLREFLCLIGLHVNLL